MINQHVEFDNYMFDFKLIAIAIALYLILYFQICHHFSPELRSKDFKPTIKIRVVPPVKPK